MSNRAQYKILPGTGTGVTPSDDDPSSEPNFSHKADSGMWVYKQMPTPPGATRFEDGDWWITTATEKPERFESDGEMFPDDMNAALFVLSSGALAWVGACDGLIVRIWAPGVWTGALRDFDYETKTPEGREEARKRRVARAKKAEAA